MNQNSEITCKGSIMLGTGCLACSKCKEELEKIKVAAKDHWNQEKEISESVPDVFECDRKPYCCPVCGGRGTLPHNFYWPYSSNMGTVSHGSNTVDCKTCHGSGVIWG